MGFLKLQFVAKYEKNERGHFGDIRKFSEKETKIEIFEQSVPKRSRTGDPLGFLTSVLLQHCEKNEGGPFCVIKKFSEKSFIVPKKSKL